MKGDVLPEYTAMFTLRIWLGIDLHTLLPLEIKSTPDKTIVSSVEITKSAIHINIADTIAAIDAALEALTKQKTNLLQLQLNDELS
jgi:hypothetical protein